MSYNEDLIARLNHAIAVLTAQDEAITVLKRQIEELKASFEDLERLSDEAVRAAENRTRDLESALASALDMVSRGSETNASLRRFYGNG
jgi:prefoldin subunit 5